jgi:hypothetical protein
VRLQSPRPHRRHLERPASALCRLSFTFTSPHASAREDTDYGYLWWLQTFHSGGRDFKCFAMYGTGGNKVYVFPRERLVAVVND